MIRTALRTRGFAPVRVLARFNSTISTAPDVAAHPSKEATVDEHKVEETTGEVDTSRHETLLYISQMFLPTGRFSKYVPTFLRRRSDEVLLERVRKYFPPDVPLEVREFIPRPREGGAFMKVHLKDHTLSPTTTGEKLAEYINSRHPSSLFWTLKWHAYTVKGRPWIEDMKTGFTSTIRVTFDGPDVAPEELYAALRQYGRIETIEPPSPGTKDLPRSTIVQFTSFFDAASARNCANGQVIQGTKISIGFVLSNKRNPIVEFFSSHPRIAVPIALALFAGLAFLIFEPIRILSVECKVLGLTDFMEYPWIRRTARYLSSWSSYLKFTSHKKEEEYDTVRGSWLERYRISDELKQMLKEGTNTFIVVYGPKGSGKSKVVQMALSDIHSPQLVIDCESFTKAKNDNEKLSQLSNTLGYHPVFLWTNGISRFVDLAAQSLSGQSAGFSETTEQQITRMLDTAASSIHRVSVRRKPKDVNESDYLQRYPEVKPVIIIRGFTGKSSMNKLIADWAGSLVQGNVAQVVFVTHDVSHEKLLANALPEQLFKNITVGDAGVAAARDYIVNYCKSAKKFKAEQTNSEDEEKTETPDVESAKHVMHLDTKALDSLGGRLTDLNTYARRIVAGEDPDKALRQMIRQSALEISQMFLNPGTSDWSPEQAWVVIKQLAVNDKNSWLPIFPLATKEPAFSTDEQLKALVSLEYRELITVRSIGGRITSLKAGRPLYHAAFRELVNDQYLCALMDSKVLKFDIQSESEKIKRVETELKDLALLPTRRETQSRQDYLASKIYASQEKINKWEKELAQKTLLAQKSLDASQFQ